MKRTKSKNEERSTYNVIRRKKRIRIKEEIYKRRHPRQTIVFHLIEGGIDRTAIARLFSPLRELPQCLSRPASPAQK